MSMPRSIAVRPFKVHGDLTYDMPPLRMIQDSGVPWGLGSDATAVTPSNPFYTLWWAVTGKMIGGKQVLKQTITREEALIAHTRSNAPFLFQEANLGSLTPGKYADLRTKLKTLSQFLQWSAARSYMGAPISKIPGRWSI